MTTNNWLPLAEYSIKHQVSISTLRRRIKAEDIQYRFEDGKYFILDEGPGQQARADEHRPSLRSDAQIRSAENLPGAIGSVNHHLTTQNNGYPIGNQFPAGAVANPHFPQESGESVITAANRLLTDLKKAYTQVLQEKETQIQSLKQELADLNTLVKVLEFENEKLREYNR